jgi:hypothetical protein
VAGRALLLHLDEERVLITIVQDFLDALDVSRGLTLLPELLARTAPEPGEAGFNGLANRFGVHVSHHQDLIALPILNNGRDQAFFIEFQVAGNLHAGFLSQLVRNVQRDENKKPVLLTGPVFFIVRVDGQIHQDQMKRLI